MRMHPRQIEAFRAVMLTGGMTAAAEHMHVSQPAVSRLIRDLEAEIGFSLFVREGNRLLPREEAVLLYREVDRLYVGLDHIGRVAQDIRAVKGGVLRIGAVSSLNGICMKAVMASFAAAYPGVTVIFDTESTDRVVDLIAIRHYDIGLVYGHEDRAGLPSEVIAQTDAVAVVAPDHPLARKDRVEAADLARWRTILPGRRAPLRLRLDRIMRIADVAVSTPIEASIANCCMLAAQGVGIAVVDPLTAAEFGDRLAVRPFLPITTMDYEIVRPPQAPPSLLVDAFCSTVRSAVRASLGLDGS